jgi:hypothetical protein
VDSIAFTGATHGRWQIFKVAFQFVAVGTFYPIVFFLASLDGRFVDGTSTYLVFFQTTLNFSIHSTSTLKRITVAGLNSNCVELVLRSVGNQQVSEATVIRFRVLVE